jgi:DNA-binding transcriptional ArsR family regulator
MKTPDSDTQRLLACLGDPSRFRVAATLLAGECCVIDLARKIGLSQSCTTRHLQALQREGIVVGTRIGKRVYFRLRWEEPRITGLIEWAMAARGRRGAMSGAEVHRDETRAGPARAKELPMASIPRQSGGGRARAAGAEPGAPARDEAAIATEAGDSDPSEVASEPAPARGSERGSPGSPARGRADDLEDFLL